MPSFPPPGVTPDVLEDERQLFLMAVFHTLGFGVSIQSYPLLRVKSLMRVSSGVHCCIFGATVYYILKSSVSKRISQTLVAYVFALFALGVIQAGTTIQYNMQALVDGGGYPGGPFAYYGAFYSLPVNTVCNTGYVIAALLADGALVRHHGVPNCFGLIKYHSSIESKSYGERTGSYFSFLFSLI